MASVNPTVNAKVYGSSRERCWAAKDQYHNCLRESGGDAKLCEKLRQVYVTSCPASWVCTDFSDNSFSRYCEFATFALDSNYGTRWQVKHFEDQRGYRDAPRGR